MKTTIKATIFTAIIATSVCASAQGLAVGSPAPPIKTGQWLKGEPVRDFDHGTVYVVDFWATWCHPCRLTMPHLSILQKKFDGRVVCIGIDCDEPDWSKAPSFVKEEGNDMDYRVATDAVVSPTDKEGFMSLNWLDAAGRKTIPSAFIVDKNGLIQWIGDPRDMDEPLREISDGTWNARQYEGNASILRVKQKDYGTALRAKDYQLALDLLKQCASINPAARWAEKERLQILMQMNRIEDFSKEINALEVQAVDNADAQTLDDIAWIVAGPTTEENHELSNGQYLDGYGSTIPCPKDFDRNSQLTLARNSIALAIQLTRGADPTYLDTLAWVQFRYGRRKEAVDSEKTAANLMDSGTKNLYEHAASWFMKSAMSLPNGNAG